MPDTFQNASSLRVGAVVLAAGAATRMGCRPKCLLELDGVPLLRRQCLALLEAEVHEIVIVLGHYADRIAQAVHGLPVSWVRNPDPQVEQATSLRLGLQALPPSVDVVLVALADQPLINATDISALQSAWQTRPKGTQWVQPRIENQPGNPAMFSHTVRDQMLACPIPMGGREWQAAHPDQVYRWVSSNPHYRTDMDSPEDIEALAQRTGLRLVWPADVLAD
jgi:molybdenum cofactor cytidylyltransferase